MLPSAVVDSFVKKKLLEELPLESVPYYIIHDNAVYFQNVLAWKEYIPSVTKLEIFVYFDSNERIIRWAIRDIHGPVFAKLTKEDFKYTTEQALLRIPFENGAKDILYNLDVIDGIFEEGWDRFNGIWKNHK